MRISDAFVRGIGRAVDLGGVSKDRKGVSGQKNDLDALRKDWKEVGMYIRRSINLYDARHRQAR